MEDVGQLLGDPEARHGVAFPHAAHDISRQDIRLVRDMDQQMVGAAGNMAVDRPGVQLGPRQRHLEIELGDADAAFSSFRPPRHIQCDSNSLRLRLSCIHLSTDVCAFGSVGGALDQGHFGPHYTRA